jgi:ATP-dependent DNA helicase RecG
LPLFLIFLIPCIVEHVSRNKYVLARRLYEVKGKSGVHTRLIGVDHETNLEALG